MGAVLVDGAAPQVIIDIVSRPATKGRAATKRSPAVDPLPKRLQTTVWVRSEGVLELGWVASPALPADRHDALDAFARALNPLGWGQSGAAVERVIGNVSPDLADVAGGVVGLLWARLGPLQRPLRPTAATWRRRMLDIPGNTPAAVAERVALERVREEVPTWPEKASGHAAEAYWIARWGAEVSGG